MRGLAAGRGAGVEDARAGRERLGQEQRRGALRVGVLDRHQPSAKPGSCVTGTGRTSAIAAPPSATAVDPARGERRRGTRPPSCAATLTRKVIGGWTLSASAIACQRSGQSARRRSSHQARMVEARQRVGERRRDDRLALAPEAAQDGVDEAGAARRAPRRRRHRLVDQRVLGVRRLARRPEQRQGDEQERVDLGRRRLRREPAPHHLGGAEPAQGMEGERLRAGPRRRRAAGERVVERLAGAHRADRVGGVTEQARQRQRGGRCGCGHRPSLGLSPPRARGHAGRAKGGRVRYAPLPDIREPRHGRREAHPDLSQRDRPRPPAGVGPDPLSPGRRRLPLPRQRQHRRLHRGRRARRAARRGRGADAGRAARARDRHRERPQHQRHRQAGRQDVPDRGVQGPLHGGARRSPSSRTSRASTS